MRGFFLRRVLPFLPAPAKRGIGVGHFAQDSNLAKAYTYRTGRTRGMNHLTKLASDLGLNMNQWNACMSSHKHKGAIQTDAMEGTALGVTGTPIFS